jgi:hypothetical protein
MSDFVKLELKRGQSPTALRPAIIAHFKYERLRRTREWLVWVPATTSLPLWIEAGWPGHLAHRAVVLCLALWAVATIALVGVLVREYTWFRRRQEAGCLEDRDPE